MEIAYVGIGSNLGDRVRHLHTAVKELERWSEGVLRCSPVYETAPVGYVHQPSFLNMVVKVPVSPDPESLLHALQNIERLEQRVRDIRYGPRTLDLDILLFGNRVMDADHLQIPHPRVAERAFVLIPLRSLAPNLKVPGLGPVAQLVEQLEDVGGVRYVGRFW